MRNSVRVEGKRWGAGRENRGAGGGTGIGSGLRIKMSITYQ